MDREEQEEIAFIDYLEARERAIEAAAGSFVVANVPSASLRLIAQNTKNEAVSLAAKIVLWQRDGRPKD